MEMGDDYLQNISQKKANLGNFQVDDGGGRDDGEEQWLASRHANLLIKKLEDRNVNINMRNSILTLYKNQNKN